MVKSGIWLKSMVVGLVLLSLGACAATYRNHGYVPTDADLENVIVGVDTQETVGETIGRPTASGLLQGADWYYVQSRWRHFAYRKPKELDREVLAIRFNQSGVVENIERFGLEDGRVIVLSRRVTDSNIRGVSFIRQLLGNLGNFTADQFLGDDN
ncbi:outer membrane protein assembly factor BamE [Aliiroseovarius sp. YM-037]|uniref:outer membrane protein assembly factor BamE n=1 Tax=Aliiroseovarius sp. YM-037 TaxID=3341728 RepID=UPI003A800EE2